ncbi:tetratricopeptide repeat protein [Hahella ganghwensis]|uniref:tetratricopeptide repeat protein n=1 Tax=Hahella ganghwensis TaxID=286420 RepID=UPI000360784A|nr:tetratricopeptide repeat protein [Hahella ganghwensis]
MIKLSITIFLVLLITGCQAVNTNVGSLDKRHYYHMDGSDFKFQLDWNLKEIPQLPGHSLPDVYLGNTKSGGNRVLSVAKVRHNSVDWKNLVGSDIDNHSEGTIEIGGRKFRQIFQFSRNKERSFRFTGACSMDKHFVHPADDMDSDTIWIRYSEGTYCSVIKGYNRDMVLADFEEASLAAIGLIRYDGQTYSYKQVQQMVENDEVIGHYLLGRLYHQGLIVIEDSTKAKTYLLKAAHQNHNDSAYTYGLAIADDSPKESLYWLEKAASAKNTSALFELGLLYEIGRSITQDKFKAFEYYKRAADLGHLESMYVVAKYYYAGRYTEKAPMKAFQIMLDAAQQDHLSAISWIAHAYEQGMVVDVNFEESYKWYLRLWDLGLDTGRFAIDRLCTRPEPRKVLQDHCTG